MVRNILFILGVLSAVIVFGAAGWIVFGLIQNHDQVVLTSQVKGYSLTWNQKDELLKFAQGIGVFKPNNVRVNLGPGTIKKVRITLVDKIDVPGYTIKGVGGIVSSSATTSVSGDVANLQIAINSAYFSANQNRDAEYDLNNLILKQLYFLTRFSTPSTTDSVWQKIDAEFMKTPTKYILLKKSVNFISAYFRDFISTAQAGCSGDLGYGVFVDVKTCVGGSIPGTSCQTSSQCVGGGTCAITGSVCDCSQKTGWCNCPAYDQNLCETCDIPNGCDCGSRCTWTGPVATPTPTPIPGVTAAPTPAGGSCSNWCANAGDSCSAHGCGTASGSCSNGGPCCDCGTTTVDTCPNYGCDSQPVPLSLSCDRDNGRLTLNWGNFTSSFSNPTYGVGLQNLNDTQYWGVRFPWGVTSFTLPIDWINNPGLALKYHVTVDPPALAANLSWSNWGNPVTGNYPKPGSDETFSCNDRMGRVTNSSGAGIAGKQIDFYTCGSTCWETCAFPTNNCGWAPQLKATMTTDSDGYYYIPYSAFPQAYYSRHANDIYDDGHTTQMHWSEVNYLVRPHNSADGLTPANTASAHNTTEYYHQTTKLGLDRNCAHTVVGGHPYLGQCNFMLSCNSPQKPVVSLTDRILKIQVNWTIPSTANLTHFYVCRNSTPNLGGTYVQGNCPANYRQIATVQYGTGAGQQAGPNFSYLDDINNDGVTHKLNCTIGYNYIVVADNQGDTNPSCNNKVPSDLQFATCINYKPWLSANGGDVAALGIGALGNNFPYPDPGPGFTNYFIGKPGDTQIPGMAFGVRGAGWTGNLDEDNVSLKKWLVNTATVNWSGVLGKSENTYTAIKRRLLNKIVTPVAITSGANISNWGGAQAQVNGVTVMTGTAPGTGFNIGATNFGTNKAIILIDGDVNINGEIRRNKTASPPGFVAIFASGNITVADTVGSTGGETEDITAAAAAPQLEGIYFAQGTWSSRATSDTAVTPNSAKKRLRVDGSVIGMAGVNLANRTAIGNYPTHYFNFQPDMTAVLNDIGLRLKVYQELQAP